MDNLLNLTQEQLKEIMSRAHGGYGISGTQDYVAGGGRVGYDIPMPKDANLNVGISGEAFKNKYMSDIKPTGLDATYSKGNMDLGMQYQNQQPNMRGMLPQDIQQNIPVQAPMNMHDLLMLTLGYRF